MRLSETITIYLAAGSPFSVSYFLQNQADGRLAIRIIRAMIEGLFWPLTGLKRLLARYRNSESDRIADAMFQVHDEEIHLAKRRLFVAIETLCELTSRLDGVKDKSLELTTFVLRENVETYVGLAPAIAETSFDGTDIESATALYRIAGFEGDDLLLATQCAHRRNIARIVEHYSRSRNHLVHAIADIRETIERIRPQIVARGIAETELRIATVAFYRCAFDLLSLVGDDEAAMKIAELLNRELSRQRRLVMMETRSGFRQDRGEEPCKAHTSRPSRVPLSSESTLARG